MKSIRLIASTALAATWLVSSIVPAAAQQRPSPTQRNAALLDFCEGLVASGDFPGLNFGECMSFNLVPPNGFDTKFCDYLLETGQLEDFGLESFSDCVRAVDF